MSRKSVVLWGCFLWLGCVPAPPPTRPPPVVTIPDFTPYLAQYRCPDGSIPTNCANPQPQRAGDTMLWRKRDYRSDGLPGGYEASDGIQSSDGSYFATVWTFDPFDGSSAGDGGEAYIIENGRARATATQDGGSAGVIQRFVGAACGGSGWLLFDNQAQSGVWRNEVARLSVSTDPNACPPLGQAYTRWRFETLPIAFDLFGVPTTLTLRCLVYEHYDMPSIALSAAMEQAVWCQDWGRVWWGAYALAAAASSVDSSRVPSLPWPAPPEVRAVLYDARLNTNIVAVGAGEATTAQWPPVGFMP